MGKEGYDEGLYLVRPSWEKFLCEGMMFKMGYKAVVQLSAGDENDPTPGLRVVVGGGRRGGGGKIG